MKSINVSELKANLSRYLRLAAEGTHIVVKDRDQPIAQIGPMDSDGGDWRQRMIRDGRLRPGTQDWENFHITPLGRSVDVLAALQDVREEPNEVRRR
jgi:antitoxin (DNA-binding transcriptional repressor) of toxin-antitoxin stability system